MLLVASPDEAYAALLERAGEVGYTVFEVEEQVLEIWHHASETIFWVTYDPANGKLVRIEASPA